MILGTVNDDRLEPAWVFHGQGRNITGERVSRALSTSLGHFQITIQLFDSRYFISQAKKID